MNGSAEFLQSIRGTWQEMLNPLMTFTVDDFFGVQRMGEPIHKWMCPMPDIGIGVGVFISVTESEIVIADISDKAGLEILESGELSHWEADADIYIFRKVK